MDEDLRKVRKVGGNIEEKVNWKRMNKKWIGFGEFEFLKVKEIEMEILKKGRKEGKRNEIEMEEKNNEEIRVFKKIINGVEKLKDNIGNEGGKECWRRKKKKKREERVEKENVGERKERMKKVKEDGEDKILDMEIGEEDCKRIEKRMCGVLMREVERIEKREKKFMREKGGRKGGRMEDEENIRMNGVKSNRSIDESLEFIERWIEEGNINKIREKKF